jgi:hypothetical protein
MDFYDARVPALQKPPPTLQKTGGKTDECDSLLDIGVLSKPCIGSSALARRLRMEATFSV